MCPYSRRVFAECCSLGRVGVSHETDDSNVLAPEAQLGRCAFESCLTLTDAKAPTLNLTWTGPMLEIHHIALPSKASESGLSY